MPRWSSRGATCRTRPARTWQRSTQSAPRLTSSSRGLTWPRVGSHSGCQARVGQPRPAPSKCLTRSCPATTNGASCARCRSSSATRSGASRPLPSPRRSSRMASHTTRP
ncbi:MAG: hypothetical protein EBS89_05580 [Proteobacteria bacterium]|nr:hypothetical protein [Pseudomonadota bacterium]